MAESGQMPAVRAILAQVLVVEPAEVTPQAHLQNDLGMDSFDLMEIVMSLEEHFDISIADDEAQSLQTVQQVVDLIAKKTGGC